ncbi:MAG: N-acetyl-gamma-glutamyl-phosphate reductase [Spirochaetaceae bacterium]|nr:N-acetyl-gamma-glutamyl-phosphate reductase [Spirochaetaceae bacterium]
MKAAVLGATGYAGATLARLLAEHPDVRTLILASGSRAGAPVAEAVPELSPRGLRAVDGGTLASVDEAAAAGVDVVFAALPHLSSAQTLEPFLGRTVVVDLSADFRIADAARFAAAYGQPPARPDLLGDAVYGLPERYRERLRSADLIASPGCFPTAVLLPLLPVLAAGLVSDPVVACAVTGLSGAGRKADAEWTFCDRSETAAAYNPGTSHRHVPEMVQEMEAVRPGASLWFTPHTAPMKRGIAATITAPAAAGADTEVVGATLRAAYGDAPFVRLLDDRLPATGSVWGSNRCDIAWRVDGGAVLLFAALDNLVKGAAGQAVQAMNLRMGLPEERGLPMHGTP